jgi:hypothetical protein
MRFPLAFLFAIALAAQSMQSSAAPAGSGYRNTPSYIEAAPGQVLIFSVPGAQARLPAAVAGRPEPPNVLATVVSGFSAELVQSQSRTPVGVYGVSQSACPTSAPCSPLTNFTVQVPFTLLATPYFGFATLEFKEGDALLGRVPIRSVPDKVHIINSCDDSVVSYSVFVGEDLSACTASVVRPRGGLITPRNPVRPGEALVAFGYGFGDASPSPVGSEFRAGLTTRPFVLRYSVAGGPVYWAQSPDGVALTTSHGNYQVHFTVPPVPSETVLPACGERGLNGNVTVTIAGIHSTDTFEICVAR